MDEQAGAGGLTLLCAARSPDLLRAAYHLTVDHARAEELQQAALAKTYLVRDRIREREAVDGYVRRVLVATQTSWWRRRRVDEYASAVHSASCRSWSALASPLGLLGG